LSLQDTQGICNGPANGVGCASETDEMKGGNPNDIVNCFNVESVGLSAPFRLSAIRFWIGDSSGAPSDLKLRVWEGTVSGGPSMNVLHTQDLVGFAVGENNAVVNSDVLIFETEFCVGVTSTSMDDGLRIQTDSGQVNSASWLMSPRCGLPEFQTLAGIGVVGDFCIEAMVTAT
jgi:hypothetical protein